METTEPINIYIKRLISKPLEQFIKMGVELDLSRFELLTLHLSGVNSYH